MSDQNEQRVRLTAEAIVNANGEFEIVPITAGEAMGHGWIFGAVALEKSLPLWDGVDCFINHDFWGHADVQDLCGVIYAPVWDAALMGPRCKFRTAGPSGPLAAALGREMVDGVEPKPKVGFSADVLFTAKDKEVLEILRVYTTDLVYDPARGGAFLRALNSAAYGGNPTGGVTMADTVVVPPSTPPAAPTPANPDVEAVRNLLQVHQEQQAVAAEMEKAKAVRVQMCAYLLDAGLMAAKLPDAAAKRVRAQFTGKAFEASELNAAIDDARALVSELTGGAAVAGLSRAREMFDTRDQLQAAVEDLFEVERDETLRGAKVAKLRGIRELYLMLTGDEEFYGGYYPDRVRLSTGNFTNLVANVMNKAVLARWDQLGRIGYDWWQKVCAVEHFTDLKQIQWTITGTIASLPSISKGAEYTPLFVGDGKETSDFTKYGGYVGIDLEDLINDDTRKLRQIPRELASAGIRNISSLVAAILQAATYTGPTMADGGVLFNNTAVTTVGGHANLTATALGTDYTAWNALSLLVYNQPMLVKDATGYAGTGKKQAVDPSIALVCRTLKPAADALFMPRWEAQAQNVAAVSPTWGGRVEPIVVPEIASTTWWAGLVDPKIAPALCIGEAFGLKPEIFVAGDQLSPAVFMNDESRLKVRHWIAVGVADFRPIARGNA